MGNYIEASSFAQTVHEVVTNHVVEVSRVGNVLKQATVLQLAQQATQGIVKTASVRPTAVVVARLVGVEDLSFEVHSLM